MAIMRAGVTHWHAGQIEVGHGLICKAYGILIVTHGPNHAITKDLEVLYPVLNIPASFHYEGDAISNIMCLYLQSMRTQTELELKMFRKNKDEYNTMREAALKKPVTSSS